MASPLNKFHVLIADSDQQLASISKMMLKGMGFTNIQITPSGTKALAMIKTGNFDFLITDWNLKDLDGISLINHIRRDPDSPNPTLPVIMLTGRMEQADVQHARDNGIHEYVVKPFSAQTIYNRLERIVEFPRYFVVGKEFVGPDRRHRKDDAPPATDRRKKKVLPNRKPLNPADAIQGENGAKLWLPDFSLKHKLGRDVTLESIITPAVLGQAQTLIDSATEASLQWVKDDLKDLKYLADTLYQERGRIAIIEEMTEIALMIASRSGTFGYTRASEVAYMLYLFCRKQLDAHNPNHYTVIEKHIEVLQIIFGQNIRNDEGDIVVIIRQLKALTDKYTM
jgi:CheY-like chemotaxis protein